MEHTTGAAGNLQDGLGRLMQDYLARLPGGGRLPLGDLTRALVQRPEQLADLQRRYVEAHARLWSDVLESRCSGDTGDGDRRFQGGDWNRLPFFRLVKESYLLNARFVAELIELAQLAPDVQRRLRFVARQAVDALAPTNSAYTNPEVLRLAAQTHGASLRAGARHLAGDLARGSITMSAPHAFEVGRNVATTEGAVVLENDVAQLIQYAPRTAQVCSRPLLIVPPFINKYYVLDLQPHNSFVRFALDQGLQVYLVSWRNAGHGQARRTWDDYVRQGVLDPIEAALQVSGARSLNTLGFCVGGTLLATALSVMERPSRVSSLTLLAAMLDFADVGDIGVYVDRDYVEECERRYAQGGIVPGAQIAASFASLRANDLVWSFVVNNYLKGRTPPAFDLLAWNADSSNLPGPLYAWYLRHLYLENRLRDPGRLRVLDRQVDLGRLRMPAYVLAAREDHIVPWTSAYASARLLPGRIAFVLSASGHVAGVVNPPSARRHFCTGRAPGTDAQEWLRTAVRHEGSWWSHWADWMRARAGRAVAAPAGCGSAHYPALEPAPGRFVREQADAARS
jgi:polyhydroxyalkanoate synthase subunit PhaC